ncbi:hypothetical protein PI126_g13381 [Phytophthora idaei]|nr:hypothetical protein PI126_g13381 [Phytophthora idaei]
METLELNKPKQLGGCHRLLWEPKLMYALNSAWGSTTANCLPVYYQHTAGFSKIQIGLLHTLPSIAAILGPPFWGGVADQIRNQRVIHVFCIIQSGPASSLLDHTVLDLLAKGGEYGRQRLFGAVGWVLQRIPPVKYDEYPALETADEGEQGVSDVTPSFLETTRLISKKMDVLVLLGVVFIMGNMHGVFSSFLQLIMCETSSELPAFFFADKIVKKIGTVNVLLVSLVGYTLRISYYALMTNAWGAIPFEFLHGITFGLTWAACTQYVFSAAPRGCEGTVMGVLSAVQNGLARASGTLIGGYFYENHGARAMWTVTGFGIPLSLISVAAFAYLKDDEDIDVPEEELLQEQAALFSPHRGDPQGLKSPMHQQGINTSAHLTYDSVQ